MIAVIAENYLNEGQQPEFFDLTADIRPHLETIDGFISVERFESVSEPGKLLSLSFWRDEKAVEDLRNLESHRAADVKARDHILKDYHIRVAYVVRDYGKFEREQAPRDSQ
ncbi:antibiotic biosynthesis monooxygenase [Ktedonosporobacter rubrisoli]|uniref:Antibiotic biosynthesis monooxygenase n=1 Tax=Ktedonosporobacter rubrisoli TaxID=2509675 RepID=A0A4P6JM91_KTERU|nr:antibiotic biosynthesis monooxygenase [Ktedonosporobacter rubrisoli]QBD75786.1 antibiotic biosynthesis monooxygenase [Ktedonosporobacter rubrisoli]